MNFYLHFVEMMGSRGNGSIRPPIRLMGLQKDLLGSTIQSLHIMPLVLYMRIGMTSLPRLLLRCTRQRIAREAPHGPFFPRGPAIAPAHGVRGQRGAGGKNRGGRGKTVECPLILHFLPQAAMLACQIDDLSQDKSVLGQRSKHQ